MRFANRIDGGRRLAHALTAFRGRDVVVLGLPRGGVPVAAEVARALDLPLDVILVRKLGVPSQPELAMGAIGEDGVRVLNDEVLRLTGVASREVEVVEAREREELARRAKQYRGNRPPVSLRGRIALIVDDGIATGSTVRAACEVAREHGAARVVVAAPVAPTDTVRSLREVADEVIVVDTPARFWAIGEFYDDFSPTSDDEVQRLLGPQGSVDEVTFDAAGVELEGRLALPLGARTVVVFAHGSGSSRHSPRNRFVAEELQHAQLGTFLLDLLTPAEERDRANVFDIQLLAGRLVAVANWVRARVPGIDVAYFGASTGAAAALWAASAPDADVSAIVSRGGRPDLAMERLHLVTAPTLLIVGGDDTQVLELNRRARTAMRGECELAIVPGATHLFEEPGTLAEAADLAREWFSKHPPGTLNRNAKGRHT
jgi:predicted phosphoribosyltransferase/predicted alpha/beta-hydrolase family hydrolase